MTEPEDKWIDLNLGPNAIDWQQGSLPAVETVPFDCVVVLWTGGYVGLVIPWGDNLNPLRWCDSHYFPQWGNRPPSGWWGYIKKGNKPRPEDVKTWAEAFAEAKPAEEELPADGDDKDNTGLVEDGVGDS